EARWEEAQPGRQGLGMALFIARHAVALHGGELRADPDTLVLRLPLRAQPAPKSGGTVGRVLVVDDDEAIAGMLGEYLAEHGVDGALSERSPWRGAALLELRQSRLGRGELRGRGLVRVPVTSGAGLLVAQRLLGHAPACGKQQRRDERAPPARHCTRLIRS